MTGDEWVHTINRLIAKTKGGRLAWQALESGEGSRAVVGPQFHVVFEYVVLTVEQQTRPRPDSLCLTLCDAGGSTVAKLTEPEFRQLAGQVGAMAFKSLFDEVVSRRHEQSLQDFRQALEEL